MKIRHYNYPLIVFKEGDKNIYGKKKDFCIVSKRGNRFYKKLTMIDAYGNVFVLKNSKIGGLAPIRTCLKYFQKMWVMDLEFDETGKISLDELKDKIINKISEDPKHWCMLQKPSVNLQ